MEYIAIAANPKIVCASWQQSLIFSKLKHADFFTWTELLVAAYTKLETSGRTCILGIFDEKGNPIKCDGFEFDFENSKLVVNSNVQPSFGDDHITRDNISLYVIPKKH